MTAPLDITTARLHLRWLDDDDAEFILRLVTDADWLRFIGDKGVHDLDSARRYIETGPAAMYREHGFGLNRVALKADDKPVGICGLLRRAGLDHADLGFALLPGHRGRGYALEASRAVLAHARQALGLARIVAIVDTQNADSIRLLRRLGFSREGAHRDETGNKPLDLYACDPPTGKS